MEAGGSLAWSQAGYHETVSKKGQILWGQGDKSPPSQGDAAQKAEIMRQ